MFTTLTVSQVQSVHHGTHTVEALCYAQLPSVPVVNKRLDEWVTVDRIDVSRAYLPKKEAKHVKNSRPASPADGGDLPWPACNLKKNITNARKRKSEGMSSSLLPLPSPADAMVSTVRESLCWY